MPPSHSNLFLPHHSFFLKLLIPLPLTFLKPSFPSFRSLSIQPSSPFSSLLILFYFFPSSYSFFICNLLSLHPYCYRLLQTYETNVTLSFFILMTISHLCLSGTLFRGGGRPGVSVAPSGGDGETARIWWRQRARRGDCGNVFANMGQSWCRHTGTTPTFAAGSHPTATAAATGEHGDSN